MSQSQALGVWTRKAGASQLTRRDICGLSPNLDAPSWPDLLEGNLSHDDIKISICAIIEGLTPVCGTPQCGDAIGGVVIVTTPSTLHGDVSQAGQLAHSFVTAGLQMVVF